jgi:hypothetical protein
MEIAAIIRYSQHVSNADFARRFGGLSVGLDPAKLTGSGGQRARLKESGGPEPFVHPHGAHDVIFL